MSDTRDVEEPATLECVEFTAAVAARPREVTCPMMFRRLKCRAVPRRELEKLSSAVACPLQAVVNDVESHVSAMFGHVFCWLNAKRRTQGRFRCVGAMPLSLPDARWRPEEDVSKQRRDLKLPRGAIKQWHEPRRRCNDHRERQREHVLRRRLMGAVAGKSGLKHERPELQH